MTIEYAYHDFDGDDVDLNDIESAIGNSEMTNRDVIWSRYDAGPFKIPEPFPHGGNYPGTLTIAWEEELSQDDKDKLDLIVEAFQ